MLTNLMSIFSGLPFYSLASLPVMLSLFRGGKGNNYFIPTKKINQIIYLFFFLLIPIIILFIQPSKPQIITQFKSCKEPLACLSGCKSNSFFITPKTFCVFFDILNLTSKLSIINSKYLGLLVLPQIV